MKKIYKTVRRLIRMGREDAWGMSLQVRDMISKLEEQPVFGKPCFVKHTSRLNLVRHARKCYLECDKLEAKQNVMKIIRECMAEI